MKNLKWLEEYPLSTLTGESKQEMIAFIAGILDEQREVFVNKLKELATDSKLHPAIFEGKIDEDYNVGYNDALLEALFLFSGMEKKADQKCVICGNPIRGFGNNASPIKEGLCCNLCDVKVVLPERIKRFNKLK